MAIGSTDLYVGESSCCQSSLWGVCWKIWIHQDQYVGRKE